MAKIQDKETRYFIDVELKSMKIIHWGFDQRENLNNGLSPSPRHSPDIPDPWPIQQVCKCR